MPLSLTILTTAFPPERRGAMVGLWGGIGGLAVAAGPLIGGAITQGLDWHWIFWVNVPIGLIASLLAVARLDESYGPATRLDLPAVGLVSGGASMALAATPTAVLGAVAPADMGKASGANSTFQRFGSVFGIAIATAVFTANGHLGTASSFTDGFRPALALAAGLSIAGAFTSLAVRRYRRAPARRAAQPEVVTAAAGTSLDHLSEELPELISSPEARWEAPVDVA